MPLAYQGKPSLIPRPRSASSLSSRREVVSTQGRLVRHQQSHLDQAKYYPGPPGKSVDGEEAGSSLPAGWRRQKDSYGRTFYRHEESGRSCWVEPIVVQLPWKYRAAAAEGVPHLLSTASDTQWVRVTLEADEDRTKLFAALYRLALDDLMHDKLRFFRKKGQGVDPSLPTLTECHKRCKKLKVPENKFWVFLERTLRGKSWPGNGSKPGSSPRGPLPRTPRSCVYSPSSRRSRFEDFKGLMEDDKASGSKTRCRSASPPRRRRVSSETNLSMAEYGSLQAKVFREKRRRQMEKAKEVRARATAQFGRPNKQGDGLVGYMDGEDEEDVPKLPPISMIRRSRANSADDAQLTEVQEIDIPATPSDSEASSSPFATNEERQELTRTLAQIEEMREELLKVQAKVDHRRRSSSSTKSNSKSNKDSTSTPVNKVADAEEDLNETLDSYLDYLEGEDTETLFALDQLDQTSDSIIGHEPSLQLLEPSSLDGELHQEVLQDVGLQCELSSDNSFNHENATALKVAREREAHLSRKLATVEGEKSALEREVFANRSEIQSLRKSLEETKCNYSSLLSKSEQREAQLQAKVEQLQIASQQEKQPNQLSSDTQEPECRPRRFSSPAISPSSPKSPGEIAATHVATKNLERLTEAQESLRRANEGRVRAERRAKDMSERVVKLTESLTKALAEVETEKAESSRLQSELAILRETLDEAVSTRDQLMDDLTSTRETSFVTLESERVERAALNREIAELRSEIVALKRHNSKHTSSRSPKTGPSSSSTKTATNTTTSSMTTQRNNTARRKRLIEQDDDPMEEIKHDESALVLLTESKVSKADGVKMQQGLDQPSLESDSSDASGASLGGLTAKIQQQSSRIEQLEKELFDAKCSLSRLTQRLKQSENDASTLRYEVKSTRQNWKVCEKKLEARVETLQKKLKETTDALEAAVVTEERLKQRFSSAQEDVDTLNFRLKDVEARAAQAQSAKTEAENQALALKRDHSQVLALKQQEMEEYRSGLEKHYAKCKAVWENDHAEQLRELKEQHANELEGCMSRLKMESRVALDEQRNQFLKQIQSMEESHNGALESVKEQHEAKLAKLQQSHNSELRRTLDCALKAEREKHHATLSEAYIQREVETVKLRRLNAIQSLDRMLRASRQRSLYTALLCWQKLTSQSRADELVEVYGGAMDQTNAAARLTVTLYMVNTRACRVAFQRWTQHCKSLQTRTCLSPPPPPPLQFLAQNTNVERSSYSPRRITSNKRQHAANLVVSTPTQEDMGCFYCYAMYPAELARKIRRKIPQQKYYTLIQAFVHNLGVNLDGKITPHTFQEALLEANERCQERSRMRPLFDQENASRLNSTREVYGMNSKEVHDFESKLCAVYLGEEYVLSPRRKHLSQPLSELGFDLQPSKDWNIKASMVLTKLSFWADRRALLAKSRAWARLLAFTPHLHRASSVHSLESSTSTRLVESDFIRTMETQALQEEVRALHVQLGASKAEAWKYKRKLLSQYLKESSLSSSSSK